MCCFTPAHVSPECNSTDITMHWKICILTNKVKALEDQMLTRLSCWKALFAAVTRCVISASKVQSEVKTLGLYMFLTMPRHYCSEKAAHMAKADPEVCKVHMVAIGPNSR